MSVAREIHREATADEKSRVIKATYEWLKKRHEALDKIQQATPHTVSMGFGPYDDAEYDKAVRENERAWASIRSQRSELEQHWTFIKTLYTAHEINLTIEELQKRVGNLPYVE
jgi:hypothetical protein